jgi:hypothetical protein
MAVGLVKAKHCAAGTARHCSALHGTASLSACEYRTATLQPQESAPLTGCAHLHFGDSKHRMAVDDEQHANELAASDELILPSDVPAHPHTDAERN